MKLRNWNALGAGVLFGLGLAVSQMVNPAKVMDFLDVAGNWDPSLALVMGGAVAVTLIAFRLAGRRGRPAFDARFFTPEKTRIDLPLVAGSAVFGIGWGLAGYCPGPGLASLSVGNVEALVFVAAMVAGSLGMRAVLRMRAH